MDVSCALPLWPAPHSVYWSFINDRAQDPFQCLETARLPRDTLRIWKYFTLCSTREPHFLSPGSHQVRPCLRSHRERLQWKRLSEVTPLFSVIRVWGRLTMFLTKKANHILSKVAPSLPTPTLPCISKKTPTLAKPKGHLHEIHISTTNGPESPRSF